MQSPTRFLSPQGFSITKASLSEDELASIKNDLTVCPHVGGDFANITPPRKFKLFMDGPNKIYMPKHYGLKKFGKPHVNRVQDGDPIDITFNGTLRSEQEAAVKAFTDSLKDDTKCGGLLNLTCASGKCLGENTPVLMYDGTIKLVQNIIPGDILMGDDSTPRNVLSTCRGRSTLYKVFQEGGMTYVVNKDHILSLVDSRTSKVVDISITDYLRLSSDEKQSLMGFKAQPNFAHKPKCPYLDPYVAGILCARGSCGMVPHYFRATDIESMTAFVNGVFHVVGKVVTKNHHKLQLTDRKLARHVCFMLTCIGYASKMRMIGSEIYELDVFSDKISIANHFNYPIHVDKNGYGCYYGFEIDGNRRFLLGDCTVTHNTVMAIHLMCHIKQKTLVVVHKDFLLNQWKERIEQFCPMAKVGLIKAQTIDVEGKDIVIGSLQSLSMKTYEDKVFEGFGFVVVDEVHHTSAEVFCRALKKISFKYTLGLSATIKRKDGLSKVFMWYLGDILYSNVKTKSTDVVHVKCLRYYSNAYDYSEEVYLKGGKVLNVAKMINNICEYEPRTQAIIDELLLTFQEDPERRVIMLSDRRGHLERIGKLLQQRNVQVGYYLGGMKPEELKLSEQQKVILGTYHMVAEGFDCKCLDTLFLASPKSDVIQSVGRILREEASKRKHVPLVVDVVDGFSIFARQAAKRVAYYKKQKYKLLNGCDDEQQHQNTKLVELKERRLVALE